MPARRFPPPWSVEELDALTSPTKSKIESLKPDQQDFNLVEKEYGPLPPNPSQAALAERYRLAQAAKVIRPLEQVAIGGKTKNRKAKRMKAGS
jgi:hypothetical protein